MRQCDPIGLAKAVLWEEAKGKLRALVAAEGARMGEYTSPYRFQVIEKPIEDFIKAFEDDGYHE